MTDLEHTLTDKHASGGIRLRAKNGEDYVARAISISDVELLMRGYDALSDQSKWFRMLHALPHLTEEIATKLCSPDPKTEVCLVIEGNGDLRGEIVGAARVSDIGERHIAEFAVTLRGEVRGLGLARQMLELLIDICRQEGCASVWGEIATANTHMLHLARRLGFAIRRDPDDFSLSLAELSF